MGDHNHCCCVWRRCEENRYYTFVFNICLCLHPPRLEKTTRTSRLLFALLALPVLSSNPYRPASPEETHKIRGPVAHASSTSETPVRTAALSIFAKPSRAECQRGSQRRSTQYTMQCIQIIVSEKQFSSSLIPLGSDSRATDSDVLLLSQSPQQVHTPERPPDATP